MNELNEREAEILERVEAAGFKVIRMEKRKNVQHELTDEERLNLSDKMGEHMAKADEAEQKKKTIDGELKKIIDDNYATAHSLNKALRDGYELIEDNCVIAIDPINKIRLVFATHNGKQIAKEVVTDEDLKSLQIKMPMEGTKDHVQETAIKAAKSTETEVEVVSSPPPGLIEIGYDGHGDGTGAIAIEGEVIPGGEANAMMRNGEQVTVTQIALTEITGGAFFATTARDAANDKQPFVLVVERPEDMELLKQAEATSEYVKLTFEDIGERNKILVKAERVEMPESEGLKPEDIPNGFEPGDDPDDGAEDDNGPIEGEFEDAGDSLGDD